MTFFEDNPSSGTPNEPEPKDPLTPTALARPSAFDEVPPGDPFTYGAQYPQPYKFDAPPPGDLQIPWSWGHLICFGVFGFFSLVFVQIGFAAYFIATKAISSHPSQKELQQFALSRPAFAIGSMVVWYALLFAFLYVTLTVFYGSPFWRSIGWKKLNPLNAKAPAKSWLYFIFGCVLSFVVMIVTVSIKTPQHAPINDILKNRGMAYAFMGMAVLVAPLVEETIFRGYLYPLFAKWFGIATSITVTGILFGLMHGSQLGWTWSLVITLSLVGVVFTFARARAETVLASFLMHLGYNSTIAFLFAMGLLLSKFGKMPPPHP